MPFPDKREEQSQPGVSDGNAGDGDLGPETNVARAWGRGQTWPQGRVVFAPLGKRAAGVGRWTRPGVCPTHARCAQTLHLP